MRHIKTFNESENYWEIEAREAKERKALAADMKSKFKYLGKKVRRKNKNSWEEGIVVLDSFKGGEQEEFIKFGENDKEQLLGAPFQVWNDKTETWER